MSGKRILVIDDERNILKTLKGSLEDEGFKVETADTAATGVAKFKRFRPDVILLDIWLPDEDGTKVLEKIRKLDADIDVIMMSGHGTIETAVKSIKLGAFDFLEKPLHFDKVLLLLQHALSLQKLRQENLYLKAELNESDEIIGKGESARKLKHLIEVTGPSNGWVLIQGENGTGKELVARALHRGSERNNARFVAVNCAAIPEELIESELFGHEKGSFTGANDKKIGKFELADGGTLFLDEVGDMSPRVQAKILRALEECCIQRVGGDSFIEVDIRVIAATNKDLSQQIRLGNFREDLFYRLNVIPITVPPLRDRKEDIPLLFEHFLTLYSPGKKRKISKEAVELLQAYEWPGNIRELKNWVERACILTPEESLDVVVDAEFGEEVFETRGDAPTQMTEKSLKGAKAIFEKQYILKILGENGGNISKTAAAIGLERSHLHKKMKLYGIREMTHDGHQNN